MSEILIEIRDDYRAKKVWRSCCELIDRYLRRPVEMEEVYIELGQKLTTRQQMYFWDAVIHSLPFNMPDKLKDIRPAREELNDINAAIVKTATKLSRLMRKRDEVAIKSGLHAKEDLHVVDWINRAADGNTRYDWHLKDSLVQLRGQYDYKYWPRPPEIVDAIAAFAEDAEVVPASRDVAEVLKSRKHSKRDTIRVILNVLNDYKKQNNPDEYRLPADFRLSNQALATLLNCGLGYSEDDLLNVDYVRSAMQAIAKEGH